MSHFKMPENFELTGGKPAILLLHAYSGSTADVRLLAGALNRAGYFVTSFNFAGHGTLNPTDILTQGSIAAWQKQVTDRVAELKKDFGNNLYVFGLSLGGIFAMDLLERDQELLGGGVFSSPIFMNTEKTGRTLPAGFKKYAQYVLNLNNELTGADKQNELDYIDEHLNNQIEQINEFSALVQAKLATINQTIFIGQGGEDEIVDQNGAYKLRDALVNCENVTFKWYENASHVITTNTARKELTNDVLEFIGNNYHEVI